MLRRLHWRPIVLMSFLGVFVFSFVEFAVPSVIELQTVASAQEVETPKQTYHRQWVEEGVRQYEKGNQSAAKQILEQAKEVYTNNYAIPYYLGLIYLKEGRRSAAMAEWKRYVALDAESSNSKKIRQYITLLLREEAKDQAKQMVANEATIASSPVDDNTIAIMPFKNIGSENLGPLGKGMAAMLISDLSQVQDLKVVDRIRLGALLREMKFGMSDLVDPTSAPRLGRLLKAKHMTTGSLTDLEKEKLFIASELMDTEDKASIDTQEARGDLTQFYDLEKKIACSLVEALGKKCIDMQPGFHKIHTKRLPALVAFSKGLDYVDEEKFDEARLMFQKALDEDPEFDLAKEALWATPVAALLTYGVVRMIADGSSSGIRSSAAGSATASSGTTTASGGTTAASSGTTTSGGASTTGSGASTAGSSASTAGSSASTAGSSASTAGSGTSTAGSSASTAASGASTASSGASTVSSGTTSIGGGTTVTRGGSTVLNAGAEVSSTGTTGASGSTTAASGTSTSTAAGMTSTAGSASAVGIGASTATGGGISTTAMVATGAVVTAGGVALAGGSSNDNNNVRPSKTPAVAGTWRGSWTDAKGMDGDVSLILTQEKTSVNGSMSAPGYKCMPTGDVAGHISGNNLELTIQSGQETITLIGKVDAPAKTFNGQWQYPSGEADCVDDSGFFEMLLTGEALVNW